MGTHPVWLELVDLFFLLSSFFITRWEPTQDRADSRSRPCGLRTRCLRGQKGGGEEERRTECCPRSKFKERRLQMLILRSGRMASLLMRQMIQKVEETKGLLEEKEM